MVRTHYSPTVWYSFLIIALVLSIGIRYTYAEESVDRSSVSGTARTEVQRAIEARHERVDAARAAFEARAATLRTNASSTTRAVRNVNLSAQGVARITAVIEAAQARIAGAITRISDISDRIEVRAVELEERGIDTAAALAYVDSARIELRAASTIMNEDLDAEVEAALAAEELRAAFNYVKESIREAANHVRAAQAALRSAVSALKEAVAQAAEETGVDAAVTPAE